MVMNKNKILNSVDIDNNGCWNWNKSCCGAGYGQLTEDRKYWNTHKYSYVVFKGQIDNGQVVRHTCHNPRCCNPEHLVLGSHKDNWNDSKKKHLEHSKKRRRKWSILGVSYKTSKEACQKTGLSTSSIIKYTVNGVFDVDAYREGCLKANVAPKV